MNILFLTLSNVTDLDHPGIYTDLLRKFVVEGHKVVVLSPVERRFEKDTYVVSGDNWEILKVKTGNIQKTGFIEKGISTILLEFQYVKAIKKYYGGIKFDLILYSTPPITLAKAIQYVKKRDHAYTYLLLKDIFPQNALDLGMLSKRGVKSLIYRFFRKKEKKLYQMSDYIGCMSKANCEYVLKHNVDVSEEKVEVCPNSIEPARHQLTSQDKMELRKKYGLPIDKLLFVYGGNLGRPQDVPFIIRCFKECEDLKDICFVVVGNGTDRHYLDEYIEKEVPEHVRLLQEMPAAEYDQMVACCDVGLIFLDHRFTIPNFPSRLLSYMQVGLPVLAATDVHTDLGEVIVGKQFGWWCESSDAALVHDLIQGITKEDIMQKSIHSKEVLYQEYQVQDAYRTIISHLN